MKNEKHFCLNHPEKVAQSFCYNCQDYFCADCLNEGKEYYYCNKKECYEKYLEENPNKNILNDNAYPYSDIFTRIIALLIDGVVLILVNSVLAVLLNLEIKDIILEAGVFVLFRHPLFFITGLLYYTLMESSRKQATIGKLIQNLVVTDLQGERISILKALTRNISKILSGMILLIGFIMAEFTKKKQALHDLIAGTLIIKLGKDALPLEVICSECNESISLNIKERILKEYDCPNCKKIVGVTS